MSRSTTRRIIDRDSQTLKMPTIYPSLDRSQYGLVLDSTGSFGNDAEFLLFLPRGRGLQTAVPEVLLLFLLQYQALY